MDINGCISVQPSRFFPHGSWHGVVESERALNPVHQRDLEVGFRALRFMSLNPRVADVVIERQANAEHRTQRSFSPSVIRIDALDRRDRRRALSLRIKISGAADGAVKLETRVPAGFLQGIASFIPQVPRRRGYRV